MKSPKPKGSGWFETPLRGSKLINVVIDQTNRFVATCSATECLLYDVKTSERQLCIDHKDSLVGCYFASPNEIMTVDECGVMRKWSLPESDDASLISTLSLGKRILHAREEGGSVIAVVAEKEGYQLYAIEENGKMVQLCDLQSGWTPSSFSISSKLLAVCQGKQIRVIAREKEAKIAESYYESRFHVDYLKESNDMNVFESVNVQADTVAAALTIGRIFIWCDVSTLGVNRATQSVHWHKSAPVIALSPFGGIISGGGECVLCKWKLGKGAPCMLPRLSSPIRQLSLSVDSALIALLLDDNSVVMIDAAAMGVIGRLPTLSISTRRKSRTLMECDPMESDMVVLGGREGCLQWIQPATSTSPFMMDVGMENGVDRDLPIYGVTQSFHSVYLSRFSRDHVVTLEEKNTGEDRCRVRVWERTNSNTSFNLLFSQEMATRFVEISLRYSTASNPFFLLTNSNGRTVILLKNATGFYMDSKKDFSWNDAPFSCASGISEDGRWAIGYSISNSVGAVVVVDVNDMRVTEVLKVSGEVVSVDWTQSHLIASCTSGVYAWCARAFVLRWRVAQRCSLRFHPILIAWIDRKIMVIDENEGTIKDSMESTGPIEDAVPFRHGNSYGILINHSGNSFSVLLTSEIPTLRRRVRSIRTSIMEAAPSSIHQSIIHSSSCLSGPVHMLPPLSLVAPSFIQSCLLPTRS
ncbi:hypothetical protein PMAYCL1PPCAC_23798 [Pristionchus mayeri]|uniref:WD40 domain-containing protein n=1 Tax=Pristionchus mayeri TaxID=1317129 RepID=A0AAN5CZF5_9BILA|nr:hypothetical protein PMAYCL1PPCAC_23798 [Pristionchus mayeri]